MEKDYDNLILVRMGEIALKGLNRNRFENRLLQNMAYRLKREGDFKVYKHDARIWVETRQQDGKLDVDLAIKTIRDVFGIVSLSPVRRFALSPENIEKQVLELAKDIFTCNKTFKFEVRRVNKKYPQNSYEVASGLGALVLSRYPDKAKVDVHNPDVTFYLEIRDKAYLYTDIIEGRRGLPVGMSGRGLLMLSGGIDSPVAGYMMASRGMQLSAVYFHTFPYTSDEAKQKVIDLAKILTRYAGDIHLHIVDFTETQLALNEYCPETMMTIVMRRMMVRIAGEIAGKNKIPALITGESLGQVASQTVESLSCTNHVADRPIFRPLIGMEKERIIETARDIDTYRTSILPYEDCCTVFVAKHPKIHPKLKDCELAERDLDIAALIEGALNKTEKISLRLADELDKVTIS